MFQSKLSLPAFGLDISDRNIEVCALEKKGIKPRLISYSRVLLDEGIVEKGNIQKSGKLIEAIKEVVSKSRPQSLIGRMCSVSLPDTLILSRNIIIPAATLKENVRKIVMHEIKKNEPISIEQTFFDYQVVSRDTHHQYIYFAAVKKNIVYEYLDVLMKAGLFPQYFDVESQCFFRSLTFRKKKIGVIKIIDIGQRYTKAFLFKNGHFASGQIFLDGGDTLTGEISKKLHISKERAEKIKLNYGLDPNYHDGKVFAALLPSLNVLASQIRIFLNRYRLDDDSKVKKIYLCGGGSLLSGIDAFFSTVLEQRVVVGNPFGNIQRGHALLDQKKAVLYADVLGLALRNISKLPYHEGINLLSQARYK